jgi:hypothetical protein
MDLKTAVKSYQFAERAKSELIICSQMEMALGSFPESERAGGKRMLILLLQSVRSETDFAHRSTERNEFKRSADLLSEAISLTESDQFEAASLKISESVSSATTAAQGAWEVLGENGLL